MLVFESRFEKEKSARLTFSKFEVPPAEQLLDQEYREAFRIHWLEFLEWRRNRLEK